MAYPLIPSSTDFQSVRDGILSLPLYFDVDLSVARSRAAGTAAIFEVAGNSLFQDQDVAGGGICKVTFQHRDFGIADPAFTSAPGFQAAVPFTRLLIENAAQAGKTARIFYGVDLDFKPASVGVVQITGGVSIAQGTRRTNTLFAPPALTTTLILSADNNRRAVIIRNTSAAASVHLGGQLITNSISSVVLSPGEVYIDDIGAYAELYAYCGSSASFNVEQIFYA